MKTKMKWIIPLLFAVPSLGYSQTNGGGLTGNNAAPVGNTAPGLPATSNSGSSPQGQMGNSGTTNPNAAPVQGSNNNGYDSGTAPTNSQPYQTGNSGNNGSAPSTVQ